MQKSIGILSKHLKEAGAMRKRCLLLVLAVLLLGGQSAWGDGDFYVITGGGAPVGTKITSLPYTIDSPGFYFLAGDLTLPIGPSAGITVNVDNVTIDLMGFSLKGFGPASGAPGISISGRNNVEIRNGTVREFGGSGIFSVITGSNCRIINIRALHNTGSGIKLLGSNHLVRNCNTSNNDVNGIWVSGYGTIIAGNVINGNGSDGLDCTSGGNLIDNVSYGNTGFGFNLSLATSDYYVIDRNTVYQNVGGSINGTPSKAVFGVNAGIP
jgi:hypothetical protein